MSSAHKESSHSSKSFNSSTSGNRGRDRMADEDFWDFDLPISRRGRFFQDSTFEDTRSDFDKKVKDILNKWGDDDLMSEAWGDDSDRRHTSNLNRYRNLRSSRNLSDDNQAVTVTNKDDAHKIVLDVMDFVAGDVKVKVVGELELLVEGRLEAAVDGGSPRTFKRNFTLPQHTDMEAVTSVMSADGILTITAPKKKTGVSGSNTGATSGLRDTSTSNKGEHNTTSSSSSTNTNNTTRDENQSRSGQHTASDFFRDVPFKKRGRFFDDACFEDTRWDFDKRVKDILSKWGDDDLMSEAWGDDSDRRHTSNLNRYRNLRNSRNLSDDNQAVTVTNKDDAHKIVLDVMDFVAGDVKVKVVGELELLVEGRLEAAVDGGSPRTFKRNFTLPQHTDMEAVTSVMSADGILTITAPKKATRGRDEGKESHVNISNKNVSESRASSTSASSVNSKMENVQQEMDKLKNDTKGEVAESIQTAAVKINTTVDAPQTTTATTTQQQQQQQQQQESSQNITYSQDTEAGLKTNLEAPRVTGTTTTQESSENITLSRETTGEAVPTIQVTTSANTESEEKAATSFNRGCEESATATTTSTTTTTQPSQQQEKVCLSGRSEGRRGSKGVALPIVTKGQFFNDSFFEGTWKNYQDAVREVLARWDRSSSPVPSDDMTSYRKLRTRDMRDENQAVTTSEDEANYKYVVDVHDFTTSGGEVTVNVLEEGQLVVEGRVEREEEGGARASRHFTREFTLPRNVKEEDIVAVMSSDGVLTIIAPKQKLVCGGIESKESQGMESVRASQGMESVRESQTGQATTTTSKSQTTHGGRKEEDVQEFVIPVIVGEASERNLLMEMSDATSQTTQRREKGISFEGLENFNDEECHKKPAGGKDCGFIEESDVDAVHRRLGEDQQKTQASQTSGEGEQTVEAEKMRRVKRVYQEEDEPYMNRLLNIRSGGGFHEDSHFAGYQNDLKAAIKEVLHKFREPVDESKGEMAAYRNLRERDLRLENQATHIDEKPLSQTVVMDVFDFMGGEVTAEVVNGRELLVKGHTKRRHGSCLTTLTFVKPIPLPEYADLKGIHAFVSSDGVLIVNIPKLEECYEVIDLAKELSQEHRPRLGTPSDQTRRVSLERSLRDSPLDLEGRVYRMSPHRILANHNITPRDRSRDRL
ncbi:hypothetical protein Pmani_011143 [Petrolisthes manimaculis]|uniref:SHSP domain-containing protein n=1 Tax=Petrolisthes manimaculis TaxID=1843537 RepID=A0AAE1Q1N8_9EUCA|nr:hypothetical protein Pmani_011143 [Petrolisthes manimaculis]